VAAMFDSDPEKVGRKSRRGIRVAPLAALPRIARRERLSIAILAVPAQAAQGALEEVSRAGIRAVLNFAPARLTPPRGVTLKAVDLKIQLENLAFHAEAQA